MRIKKMAGALAATAVVATGLVGLTTTAASAAAPTGGCATFFRTAVTGGAGSITSTVGANSYLGSPKGAWSDEATTGVAPEYTLASSGSTTVGGTRDFALTYDKGMVSFADATGARYWFFSVNGRMLDPIEETGLTLPMGELMPGDTVEGSFTIEDVGANQIVFEKLVFEANEGVRVVCSGQPGATKEVNSHTTPVATNVQTSFSAVGPTIALGDVEYAGDDIAGSHTVNNYGRAGDIINFSTSVFNGAGTGTVQLCDADSVSNCEGTGTVTANGAGSLQIPAGATTGARKLVATVGAEKARADFNVLGAATLTLSQTSGGVGTTITVTGKDFDPGKPVTVRSVKNDVAPTGNPSVTQDAAVTVVASATGTISQTYTVNDADTRGMVGTQPHRVPVVTGLPYQQIGAIMGRNAPYMTATTAWTQFAASANSCIAGTVAQPSCAVVQTLELDVEAGDLSLAQAAGEIDMGTIDLDGTNQVANGVINDLTVVDYRNSTLGWTLNAVFSGMTGAGTIPASALGVADVTCTPGANNTNTLVKAADASFVNATTAITLCAVNPTAAPQTVSGDTTAGADLALQVASNTAPGNYLGTLTFTLA